MDRALPECLLGSLFNKRPEIEIENIKFHKIFYGMKNDPEHKELLKDIRFSGSLVNPYSEMLEEALFNLQFSGCLSRKNPDLVSYSTTEHFDISYQNLIRELPKDILGKLDKFSTDLLNKLS